MEGPYSRPLTLLRISLSLIAVLLAAAPLAGQGPEAATQPSDEYLRGYAAAVLERDFGLKVAGLTVSEGVVRLPAEQLGGADPAPVTAALRAVPGVRGVQITQAAIAAAGPAATAPPAAADLAGNEPCAPAAAKGKKLEEGLLPGGLLFEPLMADPRWPHFSTSWQRYTDGGLENVWSASFGHTFVFWRDQAPQGGQWEVGVPASVFAIFDLDAQSHDLINADYWVGVENSWRWGPFAALVRLLHQSSHVGDEFLLNHPGFERVNLSYEAVDLKLAYNLPRGFRVYGGGGYLFDLDPSGFDPLNVEYGLEWRGEQTYWGGHLRPVAAADVRHWEETSWDPDLSVRAGIQLEKMPDTWPVIQFMLEFYDGHSPNGQFYEEDIQYIGAGVHAYY